MVTGDYGIEYGKIFGNWQIRELIGKGSRERTKVYRITRNSQGILEEERALKTVTVCEDANLDKMTARARAEYEENRKILCEKACNEVLLMNRLEGEPHIVGYLDWELRDRTGGTDLLIAMHLLETLETLQDTKDIICETDVLQIGTDICKALIPCQKEGVIHRDIKPANIFRRPDGKGGYLLGDFGISRIVEDGIGVSTRIGTPAYAAPEQVRMGGYDSRVDIYSLGIVLYELSNRNCLPFASSRYCTEKMIDRRIIYGEPLPVPSEASPALASVILKACAFHPKDRFQTAQEFLDALEKIRYGQPAGIPAGMAESTSAPDPYATMPLEAVMRKNPPATTPAAETSPAERPQTGMNFGKEQARALFTDDMLRAMCWDKSLDELNDACRGIRLAIPQGYTVIETDAFQGILSEPVFVGRLVIPDTVREIQERAFNGIHVLGVVEIPDSVQTIKDLPDMHFNAYIKCSKSSCARELAKARKARCHTEEWLTQPYAMDLARDCGGVQLTIPSGYRVIEEYAFGYQYSDSVKTVEQVIIPDTVDYIQKCAFVCLEVTDYIEVPASVKHIGEDAFNLLDGAYVKCERGTYAYGTCKRRGIPTSSEQARTFEKKKAKNLFSEVIVDDNVDLLIPEGYTAIDSSAFVEIKNKGAYLIVDHIKLPQTMQIINEKAFDDVIVSGYIEIPASVFIINDLPYLGPDAYVKCEPGSDVHTYCRENHIKNSVDDNIS